MENLYRAVKNISNILGTIVQYITVVIIIFLLALSVMQVVLRTFNLPQMGIEELMQFPVIWMYMLGGACASFTKTHIDCGILDSFIKEQKILDVFGVVKSILSVIVCVITIIWSNSFMEYSIKTNKISVVLGIPWVIANAAIIVGLALMLFFVIAEFIENVCELIKPEIKEVQK